MSWTTLPLAAAFGWRLAAGESGWQGSNLTLSTYWDCNGQGCDAALRPGSAALYVSSPGYGPQDPNDFGGPVYGEAMWLTGAASDALSALLGTDDGCCGADANDGGVGGCGRCLLVQNDESLHPEWTAVVMKKSRCPPDSAGCDADAPHFDIAVPGFDYLPSSSSNICGQPGTGFASQNQSVPLGSWWDLCTSWPCDLSQFEPLCDELPPVFQPGCRLFTSWGWRAGNPSAVKYQTVDCPLEFVEHVQSAAAANATMQAPSNSTTCATGAWDGCHESRCCADEGFICFAKDAYWSMCLQECVPGEIRLDDPPEFQSPWSCDVHGQVETTGAATEKATTTVSEVWDVEVETTEAATEEVTTTAEPESSTTTLISTKDGPSAPTVAPSPTSCSSGAWDSCQASRCCADEGFVCFQKDAYWAQCLQECVPGEIRLDDPPEFQSPWTCVVLDNSVEETTTEAGMAPTPAPQTTSYLRGSSTTIDDSSAGQGSSTSTTWSSEDPAPLRPTPTACTPGEWTDCTQSHCCAEQGLECFEKHKWYAQCRQDCPRGPSWSCRVLQP